MTRFYLIRYSSLGLVRYSAYSGTTILQLYWSDTAPILVLRLFWYPTLCWSNTNIFYCVSLVLDPLLQDWCFERVCWRWLQETCWLEASLVRLKTMIEYDMLHHSCTSCHEDEALSMRYDLITNCNIFANMRYYIYNLVVMDNLL